MDPLNELKSIVKSGRIPNSFLFKGPAGSGKLRAAVGFANNVFNLNKNSELAINKTLNHPDLHIIFPIPSSEKKSENNCDVYINSWRELATEKDFKISLKDWSDNLETKKQPQINIDSVRVLAKKLSLSSFGFGYKVVLFWMADRLNEAASNKLLKIVEEPGEKTVFIFITEKNKSLLGTLESRCQKLNFEKRDINDFENDIENEKAFSNLVRNAFQAKKNKSSLINLIKWSNEMSSKNKEEIKKFLMYSGNLFRQAYLKNTGADELVKFKPNSDFKFEAFSKYVSSKNIEQISDLIEQSNYNIKRNANPKMTMTNLAFDLTKLLYV